MLSLLTQLVKAKTVERDFTYSLEKVLLMQNPVFLLYVLVRGLAHCLGF